MGLRRRLVIARQHTRAPGPRTLGLGTLNLAVGATAIWKFSSLQGAIEQAIGVGAAVTLSALILAGNFLWHAVTAPLLDEVVSLRRKASSANESAAQQLRFVKDKLGDYLLQLGRAQTPDVTTDQVVEVAQPVMDFIDVAYGRGEAERFNDNAGLGPHWGGTQAANRLSEFRHRLSDLIARADHLLVREDFNPTNRE